MGQVVFPDRGLAAAYMEVHLEILAPGREATPLFLLVPLTWRLPVMAVLISQLVEVFALTCWGLSPGGPVSWSSPAGVQRVSR